MGICVSKSLLNYWIFLARIVYVKNGIELLNPTSRIVSVKNRVELLNHIQNIQIGYMCIKTGIELLNYLKVLNWVYVYQNHYWIIESYFQNSKCQKQGSIIES